MLDYKNKNDLEKVVEKYLDRVFDDYNNPKNTIAYFIQEINSKTKTIPNYLHASPLIIHWGVISECNLRCQHCYYKDNEKRYNSLNDLTTKEALNLVDAFEELNVYHVKVSGGEPFLRKDIFEILKKLKSKNIALAIQTNGTLIDKVTAKKLKEILVPNIDVIQVSLDGYKKETHELTRGKNTFDKTIQSIKSLIENNLAVQLSCTATSLNIEEIPKIYNMAKELGVKNFGVGKFKICSSGQEYLVPAFELRLKVINKLLDMEDVNVPLELSAIKLYEFLNHEIGIDYLDNLTKTIPDNFKNKNIICQKHDRLSIIGNGNVYLCDATAKDEFCLGNVKNKSLVEIWESRFQNIFFQEKTYDDFSCTKCKYFVICKGGCPMEAYKKYNTVNAPDGNCILGEKLTQSTQV